jgi:hypothetical protein
MTSRTAGRRPLVLLLLTLAAGLAIFGCARTQLSTGPPSGSQPVFVTVPPDHLGSPDSGLGSLGSSGSEDPRGKATISASKGGKLKVGRFELVFAPGALAQDTEITIVDVTNSSGFVQCQLYPEGLVFLAPVTLEADFSDLEDPSGYSMYWRVPTSMTGNRWIDVGGESTEDGVITTLEHFSDYAPGKAGW